ncbi:MAG: immunoglobulin-like domain-containing protein [Streptosporangiales bacterium]
MRTVLAVLVLSLVAGCGQVVGAGPPGGSASSDEPPAAKASGVARVHTAAGEAVAKVALSAKSVDLHGTIGLQLVNRGEVDLLTGLPFEVERWNGQQWVRAWPEPGQPWPAIGIGLGPGERTDRQNWHVQDARNPVAGWYRIGKTASYGGYPWHDIRAVARFRVLSR